MASARYTAFGFSKRISITRATIINKNKRREGGEPGSWAILLSRQRNGSMVETGRNYAAAECTTFSEIGGRGIAVQINCNCIVATDLPN